MTPSLSLFRSLGFFLVLCLYQVDISLSSGRKAEFECESAHGTAVDTSPRSCLLPDSE